MARQAAAARPRSARPALKRTPLAQAGRQSGSHVLPRRGLALGPGLAALVLVVLVLLAAGALAARSWTASRDAGGAASREPIAVLRTGDFHALAFSPDDPNVVFFGHHNGVMRSDDGGRTWRPLVERRNLDAMGGARRG